MPADPEGSTGTPGVDGPRSGGGVRPETVRSGRQSRRGRGPGRGDRAEAATSVRRVSGRRPQPRGRRRPDATCAGATTAPQQPCERMKSPRHARPQFPSGTGRGRDPVPQHRRAELAGSHPGGSKCSAIRPGRGRGLRSVCQSVVIAGSINSRRMRPGRKRPCALCSARARLRTAQRPHGAQIPIDTLSSTRFATPTPPKSREPTRRG